MTHVRAPTLRREHREKLHSRERPCRECCLPTTDMLGAPRQVLCGTICTNHKMLCRLNGHDTYSLRRASQHERANFAAKPSRGESTNGASNSKDQHAPKKIIMQTPQHRALASGRKVELQTATPQHGRRLAWPALLRKNVFRRRTLRWDNAHSITLPLPATAKRQRSCT